MYKITKGHPKYNAIITLLSFRSPFEFIEKIEKDLCKDCREGKFLLDEYAHNDSEEKRFIFFQVKNGNISDNSFEFTSVDDDTRATCDSILKENKERLEEIGIDIKF